MAQSTLVRVQKVSWHRFLGWFGVGLASLMVPLGTAIAGICAALMESKCVIAMARFGLSSVVRGQTVRCSFT
jgi:hypothetical protein